MSNSIQAQGSSGGHWVSPIDLNDAERDLLARITWDLASLRDHKEVVTNLERAAQLAQMLLDRGAVPPARVDYFVEPAMNPGGRGKSKRDIFEGNGTKGEDILRHPHFLKYLKYFIHGPDLPASTIRGFCQILAEDAGTTGEVLDQVTAFVRKEVRAHGLDRGHAAEEFFKLAHEVGRPDLAENVRSAAKQARR